MEIGQDKPLILECQLPLHKNLTLTLVLHAYHCKDFVSLSLQTLHLKASRYQVHWAGLNKMLKYSHAKVLMNHEHINTNFFINLFINTLGATRNLHNSFILPLLLK